MKQEHGNYLFISQLLSEVSHDMTELSSADETVAVFVEHPEGLSDLFLTVCVFHLPGHHGEKLGEVDGSVAVGVHLVDHILELSLGGVLSQRSHNLVKFTNDIEVKFHTQMCVFSILR